MHTVYAYSQTKYCMYKSFKGSFRFEKRGWGNQFFKIVAFFSLLHLKVELNSESVTEKDTTCSSFSLKHAADCPRSKSDVIILYENCTKPRPVRPFSCLTDVGYLLRLEEFKDVIFVQKHQHKESYDLLV